MTIDSTRTGINLSPLFSVLHTQNGRACFSNEFIAKNTDVLMTGPTPFGSTILFEFRKEVCAWCLQYDIGKTWKLRLPNPDGRKKWLGAGLWFCSEECVDHWSAAAIDSADDQISLSEVYETILLHFKQGVEPADDDCDKYVGITKEYIDDQWRSVNEWEDNISQMKPSKRLAHIPALSEEGYNTARFIASVLFNLHVGHQDSHLFPHLQSNELPKLLQYGESLLNDQTTLYKFLRLTLPTKLQSYLTTETFRLIQGSEFGNSFGIWQQYTIGNSDINLLDQSSEGMEFLGYFLQPCASFFNHSCAPNLKKYRVANRMHFRTTRDIQPGEQLCIDYLHVLDSLVLERRRIMSENWFFECSCDRCVKELSEM